jgi:hypothetical protein
MRQNRQEKMRKSANLTLADPGKSNTYMRIKRENEMLISHLRFLHDGPFGIWKWFRK